MRGSGKTTYWLRRIQQHRAKWKFVFDPGREVARKLGWLTAVNDQQLVWLASHRRPICFDSSQMFPGQRAQGFDFFCSWVFNVCKVIDGPKVFATDEIQGFTATGAGGIPPSFGEIVEEGRREEIDLLLIAQRLNKVNDNIRGQLTEIVTFRHVDALPLKWLEEYFPPDAVRGLRYPGGFLHKDLIHATGIAPIDAKGKANRPARPDRQPAQKHRG